MELKENTEATLTKVGRAIIIKKHIVNDRTSRKKRQKTGIERLAAAQEANGRCSPNTEQQGERSENIQT